MTPLLLDVRFKFSLADTLGKQKKVSTMYSCYCLGIWWDGSLEESSVELLSSYCGPYKSCDCIMERTWFTFYWPSWQSCIWANLLLVNPLTNHLHHHHNKWKSFHWRGNTHMLSEKSWQFSKQAEINVRTTGRSGGYPGEGITTELTDNLVLLILYTQLRIVNNDFLQKKWIQDLGPVAQILLHNH